MELAQEKKLIRLVFSDLYNLFEIIGKGPFSVVRRCTNKSGDKQYAVKIIDVEQFTATPGFSAD
ncbi:unnamed protein product, partial [Adineta steineri]